MVYCSKLSGVFEKNYEFSFNTLPIILVENFNILTRDGMIFSWIKIQFYNIIIFLKIPLHEDRYALTLYSFKMYTTSKLNISLYTLTIVNSS